MYNNPNNHPCPYYANTPYNPYKMYQCPCFANMPMLPAQYNNYPKAGVPARLIDYGPNPFVVDIQEAAKQNNNYRTALWTGSYLQLTLMSINAGEDIGLEMHPDVDQFICIEEGQGHVKMGDRKDMLDFQANVGYGYAIFIPAGKWHNLINTGNIPIKLYSIYAPPQHPHGTVQATKAIAQAAE